MSKNRTDRKRQKYLAHLTAIAEAFLKARAVYPPGHEGFLHLAGQREVDVFYQTMHLVEQGARKYGFDFRWSFDESTGEWPFEFVDLQQ